MTVGKIGSPTPVPQPGTNVVNAALALLAGFGAGGTPIAKKLSEMQAVQEANEKLHAEIGEAILEIAAREEAVVSGEEDLRRKRARWEAETERRDVAFAEKEHVQQMDSAAQGVSLAEREAELARVQHEVEEERKSMQNRARELDEWEEQVSAAEARATEALEEAEALRVSWTEKVARLKDFGAEIAG